MASSLMKGRFPSGAVRWQRRPFRGFPKRLSAQSAEGLTTNEGSDEEADLFTELLRLSQQQKEIRQREEDRKKSLATTRTVIAKPTPVTESLAYEEIDEMSQERAGYHNSLFLAAKKGDAAAAENVIRVMIVEGLQPGPKAFHALVFAYVKAGSASGALAAIRRAHSSGARPLTESYIVLIYAFMKEKNIKNAEAVFTSMLRPNANVDAEQGWIMLTTMLFREGFQSKALICLEDGKRESFIPDRYLYRRLIQYYCQNNAYENALEELNEVLVYQGDQKHDLYCEMEHVRGLMEFYAEQANPQMLMWLMSLPKSLDLAAYNTVLHGILKSWDQEGIQGSALFESVWESLTQNGDARADEESYLLFTEAELKRGELMNAEKLFVQYQLAEVRSSKNREQLCHLLTPLLNGLSAGGKPISLHNVLTVLSVGCSAIPDEAVIPDQLGRTFGTQWMERRVPTDEGVHKNGTTATPERQVVSTSDGRRAEVIDGILIGFCQCAVTEDGMIVPLSKMKVADLRAECQARGLNTEGNRPTLLRAVRSARHANPSIKDEIKRSRSLARKQKRMTASKESPQPKASSAEVKYKRYHYAQGKLINVEEVSQSEAEEFLKAEEVPLELDEEEIDEELREFVEKVRPGEDKKRIEKWSDVYALRSRQTSDLGTNETAGVNAAASICEMIWSLECFPSLEDFEAIARLNAEHRSPLAALKLGILVNRRPAVFQSATADPETRNEEYESRLLAVVHACCRICLSSGFPDSCEQIIEAMRAFGREPESSLLKEIEDYRRRGGDEVEGVAEMLPDREPRREMTPELLTDEGEEEAPLEDVPPIRPPSSDEEESLEGFGGVEELDKDEEGADVAFSSRDSLEGEDTVEL